MLTTRVIPTSGRAFVGGIDVVAHPTAAKQVIGVVPQTNTLDRSLTVWENLYFHGRFFGMSAVGRPPRGRPAARRSSGWPSAATEPVARALRRHGPAPDGGAGDHAPPGDPVPRRADRRSRSRRAVSRCGRSWASSTATARPSSSPRTTWRRPTSSATGSRSSTTATCSRSGTPDGAEAVDRRRHRRHGHRDRRPRRAGQGARGRGARRAAGDACRRHRRGRGAAQTGRAARSCSAPPSAHGFDVTDLSITEPTLETVFINLTGKDLRE